MRVYLDTNILAFLVGQDKGESISRDVMELLQDYEVVLLSSAVCFQELVHLVQIGSYAVLIVVTWVRRLLRLCRYWRIMG